MKRSMKTWLAPLGVCGLVTFAALAGSRMVTAQAQPPEVVETVVVAESDDGGDDDDVEMEGEPQEEIEGDAEALREEDDHDDRLMNENEVEEDNEVEEAVEEAVEGAIADEGGDEGGGDDAMAAEEESEHASEVDELESRTNEIVEQIGSAKENREFDRVSELKAELLNVTRTHFQMLEARRREQVVALERKLEMLKEVLDNRARNADQIIDRRIKTLLQESDSLDWNPKIDNRETWRSESKSRGDEEARKRFSRDWLNREVANELLDRSRGDKGPVLSDRYRELESLRKREQAKLELLDRQWANQLSPDSVQPVNPELRRLLEEQKKNLEGAIQRMDAERAKFDEQVRKQKDAWRRDRADATRY